MSQIRRRQIGGSTSGYITDGLVFHLDSVDATSDQWVDRIGGLVYTLNNTVLSNGGVYFSGSSGCNGHADSRVDVKYDEGTIEVVANGTGQNQYAIFTQPKTNNIAFIVFSTKFLSFAQLINHKRYEVTSDGFHTLSVSISRMYKDTVEYQANGSDYFTSPAGSGSYIGENGNGGYRYKGTVYQIRIYNRILTEEEILHNQNIDIKRYNIT